MAVGSIIDGFASRGAEGICTGGLLEAGFNWTVVVSVVGVAICGGVGVGATMGAVMVAGAV